jgi:hypothetical protein
MEQQMSILSALQRTPEQDAETDAALADNRKAAARKVELEKDAERLHLQMEKRRKELAEASFEGNEAASETAQRHLEVLKNKISANQAAIAVAEERIASAIRRLHLANVAGWLRTARKLTNKRLKYATEASEGLAVYIRSRRKLMEATQQVFASYPLPGSPPQAAIFSPGDIDRLLEKEILRLDGINPLSDVPRCPGASNNPYLALSDLVPLATEIERGNQYLIKTIEDGGPNAPPAPIPALPDASVPDADDDLLGGGATLTEAQIMAMMPKHEAVTIDNRKGGTDVA